MTLNSIFTRPLTAFCYVAVCGLTFGCGSRGSETADDLKVNGVSDGNSSCNAPPPVDLPAPPAFKVVGYAPSWAVSANAIQYDKLDFVAYAFALPSKTGEVRAIDNGSKLTQIVTKAHEAGTRVLIAVGGWNNADDSAFEEIVLKPELRTKFVDSLMSIVDCYGLDGIDLDWEYPEAGDEENFGHLLRELSGRLRPQKKFLTAAVVAVEWNGFGIAPADLQYFDFLNIMAYDAYDADKGHSSMDYARASLDAWFGLGLTKEKAMLGVPFYGRSTTSPELIPYSTLVQKAPDVPSKDSVTLDDHEYWYNGVETMKSKVALAKAEAGGIMIWDLSQDLRGDGSLLSVIDAAK